MGVGELERARLAFILRKVCRKGTPEKRQQGNDPRGGVLGSSPGRVITPDMM